MARTLNITLDLYNENRTVYKAKQGDANSRFLLATITELGVPFTIPSNNMVFLKVRKPDETCTLTQGVISDGKALVELTNQTLAVAGIAYCEIRILQNDPIEDLKTIKFTMQFDSSVFLDEIVESTDEFTALQEALATAGSIGHVSELHTIAKNTLVDGVNELADNQGTMADLTTTADTLVGAINELDSEKEDKSNKVTSISGASTDTQYPSAKLTYDQLATKEPNLPVTPENPETKFLNGNKAWATPAHNKITDLNADADYQHITTTQVNKLTNIEENAEVNIIETVSIDGADITPDANRNIDIPLATSTNDGAMSSEYAGKLDGIAENANNYVHPNHTGDVTSDGDGATTIANDAVTNAKLANMPRGTVKVGGDSDAPTDLNAKTSGNILIGDGTDLKSVAVTGDVTISNTGVTAIGNNKVTNAKLAQMNTKTIKGNDTAGTANAKDLTVAEAKALLDIDDLEMAVTELQADVNIIEETPQEIYGLHWDKVTKAFTRTNSARGAIVNLGVDNEVKYNEMDFSSLFSDWEEVTDSYGNVFARVTKIYLAKTDDAAWRVNVASKKPIKKGYLPYCFWDFVNNKELPYVDIGKHIGSLSEDGTRLESKPGKYPLVNKSIVQMRTLAQANGAGYQLLDIHAVDLLQTLFTIEQATVDSQSKLFGYANGRYTATDLAVITESDTNRVVLPNATAALYEVGQSISIGTTQGGNQIFYGRTILSIEDYDASNKALIFDGDPVSITAGNMVYNSGYKTGFSSNIASSVGSINSNSSGKHPFVWHGIESLYGDVWQFVDGININDNQTWICKNAENYASNFFAYPYEKLNYVNANTNNYVIAMGYDPAHPYAQLPITVGVSGDSQYKDYYYQATGQRIALVGGSWYTGSNAGLFCWNLGNSSAVTLLNIGGRLLKKAL